MVGIDLVEHKDFVNKDERFIIHVLSDMEYKYYLTITNEKRKLEYLASRFACKEAIIKCIGHKINFTKISILNKESGAPYVLIDNIEQKLQLSLSHTDSYSVAICINLP